MKSPRWLAFLLVAMALIALCVWSVHAGLLLWFPFQVEFGEGVPAVLSTALHQGGAIYRDANQPPFWICPYTPLHLCCTALLMNTGLGALGAGRLVAELATLAALASIVAILRRRHGLVAAAAGAGIFLCHPLVIGWSCLDRVDMLALALATGALNLADRTSQGDASWGSDLVLALLMALAFLTKQSYVAASAAILIGLVIRRPRRAVRLGCFYVAMLGASLWALQLSSGGHALAELFLDNADVFSTAQMWHDVGHYLLSVAPVLVAVVWYMASGGLREQPMWAVYLVLATAMGFGSGRFGGYYNYFLELHVGLAVVGGQALGSCVKGWPVWMVRCCILLQLVGSGMFTTLPATLYSPWDYLVYETASVARGHLPAYLRDGLAEAKLAPYLDRCSGPVLAENMANVVAFGRLPWFCGPSIYTSLAQRGLFDPRILVRLIAEHRFGLIVVQRLHRTPRFLPVVARAIESNYKQVAEAGLDRVMVPR